MIVYGNKRAKRYTIRYVTEEDLRGLDRMIKEAALPERRQFYALRVQIERILKDGTLPTK